MSGLGALLGWTVVAISRSPATWILLAALWTWWALGSVLGPVGLASASAPSGALFYELAFASSLAGSALALGPKRRARWLLERAEPAHRARLEFAQLVLGGCLGLVAGTLPEWLLGPASPRSLSPFLLGGSLGLIHLAALGRLVGALRLPAASEPVVLVLLAWFVPAMVTGSEFLPRALDGMLDVARSWRGPEPADLLRTVGAALALTLTEGLIVGRLRAVPATAP